MPEITNPFKDERKPSRSEVAQQWASLAQMGFSLIGVELYEHERDALATVIGAVLRAFPHLKEIGQNEQS